jgi:hypothetical protein
MLGPEAFRDITQGSGHCLSRKHSQPKSIGGQPTRRSTFRTDFTSASERHHFLFTLHTICFSF